MPLAVETFICAEVGAAAIAAAVDVVIVVVGDLPIILALIF